MLNFYNVTSLDGEYRLICDNGGFEGVVPLADYRFFSDPIVTNLECAVAIPQTVFLPLINNFGALATLIDNSDISWNATMQFDGTLNTPAYGNIQISTLSPNAGSRAIKLNNNNGGNDVTTMSRDILINDNVLEYEFSLILQNSNHAGTNQQPIFKVEIFDLNGNLIQQRCIISQPDCNFTLAPFNLNPAHANSILFTDWICDAVDVSALIDAPVVNGVNATVTFTIADCGRGGHFGTVYIDNICNFTCGNPAFGLVQIEPVNGCPDYINNTPFEICGEYNVPANANNVNFTINFSTDDGQTFNPIDHNLFNLVINSLTNQTGNFCFQLNPSFFLTDPNANYLFQIVQTFDQNCALGTFPVVNSSLAVVNISQCCLPTLTSSIAISGMVQEERELWINSTDFITFQDNVQGNGVVYHAGNFVELNPGFEAVFGSKFAKISRRMYKSSKFCLQKSKYKT
ncbi:hypothetical protein H9X57_15310 [Flavobacterium piscinae]|uniref:3-coathanger stack domain-containing protein n=1 Tax=Flavobacterium piscinae TaxID=2506424 RepID=UPI0019BF345B|nr:3-coathanger stack domain-containing protein [Flavobacterium piscinae]MBC8884240.1 hypothetical protein [Flavobacterium piscinae]